jgi:hypothetical protein
MKRFLKQFLILVWAPLVVISAIALAPAATTYAQNAPAEEAEVDCADNGEAIAWIICPVIKSANEGIKTMDTAINNLLDVDEQKIFGGTGASANEKKVSDAYYKAWSSFRTFALAFVIIMALIVIISTAFGYEILDAYTIRKVLPRLLIAIIGITLSWSILAFLITLTNDVGNGIRAIIYAPFNDLGLSGGGNAKINIDDSVGVLATILLSGAFLALGLLGLLSFGLTALLAVFCAFLVLVLRELVIIVLVLIAPLAIACLILPNTRKFWQFWQNTMTAMLLAFPIIAAMIATGRVFSQVTLAFDSNNLVNNVVAFFAYIIPYFMLPFAFKFAGGILGTLSGMTSNGVGGMSKGLQKYRQNQSAQNMNKMKTGTRFQGSTPGTRTFARGFNRTTAGLATGVSGRFGMGTRGAEALNQTRLAAGADLMKDPKWATIKDDDNAIRALTYDNAAAARSGISNHLQRTQGMSAAAADTEARRATAAAQTSVGFGRPQAMAATNAMIDTGTSFHDLEDLSQTIARASGGNESSVNAMAGYANARTKAVGRHDLAPGFGDLSSLAQGERARMGGGAGPTDGAYRNARTKAWQSGSLYQHANDKPDNIKRAIKHHKDLLANGGDSEKNQARVFFAELKQMQPNASGAVAKEINDTLSEEPYALAAQRAQETPDLRRAIRQYERVDPNRLDT